MLYKFLIVLSIFFASFVFAGDLPGTGVKREWHEGEQPPAKKRHTFCIKLVKKEM